AEGVRRGGVLVSVTAPDDRAERAADIMNQCGAIDVKRRAAEWQKTGWTGYTAPTAEKTAAPATARPTSQPATPAARAASEGEVRVPIMTEESQSGKRAIERGGVRIYSHVTEPPIERKIPSEVRKTAREAPRG